jgi:hypothetical protein
MKAQYVYESLSFNRGLDPKASMGIGKFGNLIKNLTELYTDIFPSYTLNFRNIPSDNLDREPHKFIGWVDPIKKDGQTLSRKDLETIKGMLDSTKDRYIDMLLDNRFYPVTEEYSLERTSSFSKFPIFTILYDEMG